jgi:hypothetical protein
VLLAELPRELEDGAALLKRRERAKQRKDNWRSLYQDAQRFAMPARETFSWVTEGQHKNSELYDTTLQDMTYSAANTMLATLFPPWTRWAEYKVADDIPADKVPKSLLEGLKTGTETFFNFLNHSTFGSAMSEVALDLLIGTGALTFDEGDDDQPFKFTSTPLSALELEEGPDGTAETKFMCREILARNIQRTYPGTELFDMPQQLAYCVMAKPDEPIRVLQCEVYYPPNKRYYGIAVHEESKHIFWRFDYGISCPTIVARATKVSGELYGRGRVLLALSDAKTLNKMVEFVLKHAHLQIAPPFTAVGDGVVNPYTTVLTPNTVIPVASNDNGNPSIRVLETGGNFQITDALMETLRDSIRRKMMGPARSETAIKSASEINLEDRDRLWAMGGEFARIQVELLAKIMARGAYILQNRGLMPKFKVDGKVVSIKYTSPFAKSQAQADVQALVQTVQTAQLVDPSGQAIGLSIKTENVAEWVGRKLGLDESLIRDEAETADIAEKAQQALTEASAADTGAEGEQPAGGAE